MPDPYARSVLLNPTEQSVTDDELFRDAMAGVTPLKRNDRHKPEHRKLDARPRSLEADNAAVMAELLSMDMDGPSDVESGDELSYRSAGVQDTVYRRLKRGTYHFGAELDLHGLRVEPAREAVREFIVACRERNIRCVRIIHGKGLGSDNRGPVLKQWVDGWLRRRSEVLAFCSAQPRHGGTGAVYVLLRRS